MRFKGMAMLAAAVGSLALAAGAAQAATQIVNVSARDSAGTTVALAADSYTVTFIGQASGGLYDAWNPWGTVSGCSAEGTNCANGWAMSLAVDFGSGTSAFSRVDGFQFGQLAVPGDNHNYATALQALAQIQTADLVYAPLPQVSNPAAYLPTSNPISFTLGGAQSVNFFIYDYPYGDNSGGVSILLDDGLSGPVPEPASWAMLIAGMGVVGAAMRRRRAAVSFA